MEKLVKGKKSEKKKFWKETINQLDFMKLEKEQLLDLLINSISYIKYLKSEESMDETTLNNLTKIFKRYIANKREISNQESNSLITAILKLFKMLEDVEIPKSLFNIIFETLNFIYSNSNNSDVLKCLFSIFNFKEDESELFNHINNFNMNNKPKQNDFLLNFSSVLGLVENILIKSLNKESNILKIGIFIKQALDGGLYFEKVLCEYLHAIGKLECHIYIPVVSYFYESIKNHIFNFVENKKQRLMLIKSILPFLINFKKEELKEIIDFMQKLSLELNSIEFSFEKFFNFYSTRNILTENETLFFLFYQVYSILLFISDQNSEQDIKKCFNNTKVEYYKFLIFTFQLIHCKSYELHCTRFKRTIRTENYKDQFVGIFIFSYLKLNHILDLCLLDEVEIFIKNFFSFNAKETSSLWLLLCHKKFDNIELLFPQDNINYIILGLLLLSINPKRNEIFLERVNYFLQSKCFNSNKTELIKFISKFAIPKQLKIKYWSFKFDYEKYLFNDRSIKILELKNVNETFNKEYFNSFFELLSNQGTKDIALVLESCVYSSFFNLKSLYEFDINIKTMIISSELLNFGAFTLNQTENIIKLCINVVESKDVYSIQETETCCKLLIRLIKEIDVFKMQFEINQQRYLDSIKDDIIVYLRDKEVYKKCMINFKTVEKNFEFTRIKDLEKIIDDILLLKEINSFIKLLKFVNNFPLKCYILKIADLIFMKKNSDFRTLFSYVEPLLLINGEFKKCLENASHIEAFKILKNFKIKTKYSDCFNSLFQQQKNYEVISVQDSLIFLKNNDQEMNLDLLSYCYVCYKYIHTFGFFKIIYLEKVIFLHQIYQAKLNKSKNQNHILKAIFIRTSELVFNYIKNYNSNIFIKIEKMIEKFMIENKKTFKNSKNYFDEKNQKQKFFKKFLEKNYFYKNIEDVFFSFVYNLIEISDIRFLIRFLLVEYKSPFKDVIKIEFNENIREYNFKENELKERIINYLCILNCEEYEFITIFIYHDVYSKNNKTVEKYLIDLPFHNFYICDRNSTLTNCECTYDILYYSLSKYGCCNGTSLYLSMPNIFDKKKKVKLTEIEKIFFSTVKKELQNWNEPMVLKNIKSFKNVKNFLLENEKYKFLNENITESKINVLKVVNREFKDNDSFLNIIEKYVNPLFSTIQNKKYLIQCLNKIEPISHNQIIKIIDKRNRSNELLFMKAKSLKEIKMYDESKKILKRIMKNKEASIDLIDILLLKGELKMKTYDEEPLKIVDKYFEPCLKAQKNRIKVLETIGNNLFEIYEQFNEKTTEGSFQNHQNEMIKKLPWEHIIELQFQKEKNEQKNLLYKKVYHILLEIYLELSKTHDESNSIFKLLVLIFDSNSVDIIDKINEIPAYRFLDAKYQIISNYFKLKNENKSNEIIKNIIRRLIDEHFFHVIYEILTYETNQELKNENSGEAKRKRIFLEELEKSFFKPEFDDLLNSKKMLIRNIKMLIQEYKNVGIKEILMKNQFEDLPIPTSVIPISSQEFIGIHSFSTKTKKLSGITKPILIQSIGTDGKTYNEIIKSNDELRQDIIASQIFTQMNYILKGKRLPKIRTYKIIRFEKFFGVIEYLQGTKTMGDIVSEFHTNIYPNEYDSKKCRLLFNKTVGTTIEEKIRVYEDICSNFTPCLEEFFFKNSNPFEYIKKKMNFTQSLGLNSISTYILGLGDRHCYNILFDESSGEIINIDLNLLFDQGRLLKTPEKIPYRMTRNFTNSLFCKIKGRGKKDLQFNENIFLRDIMADVFEIFKLEKSHILSLMAVFKNDPLHKWSVTEKTLEKLKVKGNDIVLFTDSKNIISRMTEKLNGIESGFFLNNDSHVCFLLQKSTDINNLVTLFPGWQPWV